MLNLLTNWKNKKQSDFVRTKAFKKSAMAILSIRKNKILDKEKLHYYVLYKTDICGKGMITDHSSLASRESSSNSPVTFVTQYNVCENNSNSL